MPSLIEHDSLRALRAAVSVYVNEPWYDAVRSGQPVLR